MLIRRTSGIVSVWYVVFSPSIPSPIWQRLIPGKWKHVYAFGHCEPAGTWIFIDPEFRGTKVSAVPDHEAEKYIRIAALEGAVIRIKARELASPRIRTMGCCTMTIRHLVGLPGALPWNAIPDKLFSDCIRAGGEIVYGA
jgi:hypothetical protein